MGNIIHFEWWEIGIAIVVALSIPVFPVSGILALTSESSRVFLYRWTAGISGLVLLSAGIGWAYVSYRNGLSSRTLQAEESFSGLRLPAGTRVMEDRKYGELRSAVLQAPAKVGEFLVSGNLRFASRAYGKPFMLVSGTLVGDQIVNGVPCRGNKEFSLHPDYDEWVDCTLASAFGAVDVEWPAGTVFRRVFNDNYYVTLAKSGPAVRIGDAVVPPGWSAEFQDNRLFVLQRPRDGSVSECVEINGFPLDWVLFGMDEEITGTVCRACTVNGKSYAAGDRVTLQERKH